MSRPADIAKLRRRLAASESISELKNIIGIASRLKDDHGVFEMAEAKLRKLEPEKRKRLGRSAAESLCPKIVMVREEFRKTSDGLLTRCVYAE